eukprot:CAMPEP_0181234466 /NCGR_PEP_ID=MMETSP1096-20121128/36985_1 /TAXON_ID=156174 ORGANISM="Chrysochromulina ericina, Strain CCMP281" /NCGR_SAMPLE_ID=MMETSP1096 /ASSEMBLY_ACC=CAM_ASM_000453 /LENGTH=245 /DNA_ID=CAMNT_0023329237 /DNA_START=240 /DNA_END=978 /DNA_ORIENTATION=-
MRADPKASADAKARGGFWGPWRPNGPFVPPHPPPGPSPGPHPVPPEPPSEGFAIIRAGAEACPGYGCEGMDASSANACLTVDGLSRESRAVLGPCDGGSKWEVREGGLANVAAKKPKDAFLRQSPARNCTVGNTAQLGIEKESHAFVTKFDETRGLLIENACDDLCLAPGPAGKVMLRSCKDPESQGWERETYGPRADPFGMFFEPKLGRVADRIALREDRTADSALREDDPCGVHLFGGAALMV